MTVAKTKPKLLHRPIKTGANSPMNQSEFLAITCNLLKAQEKSRVHGAIGFGSNWLKNSREAFKPIAKRSNRNHIIIFDSHLKTALMVIRTNDNQCVLGDDEHHMVKTITPNMTHSKSKFIR